MKVGRLRFCNSIYTQWGLFVRAPFSDVDTPDVDNLYAVWAERGQIYAAGHTDVVPEGAVDEWSRPAFGGKSTMACYMVVVPPI